MTGNLLTDHPELYEARFPDPDRLAARFVDDLVRRFGAGPGRLLDLGCGTGRDAGWWAAHGYDVTGLDSSAAMLDHARRRHPAARFVAGDLRGFDLGTSYDVVTCLDSALLYCHTNAELESGLAAVRRHLVPGGLLVAELRNGAYYLGETDLLAGPRTSAVTHDGTRWVATTTLTIDHAAQLLRRHRVWSRDGVEPLVQTSAWRLLFPAEIRGWLDRTGLELVAMFDHPGPRTEPPWPAGTRPQLSPVLSGDRLHLVVRRPND